MRSATPVRSSAATVHRVVFWLALTLPFADPGDCQEGADRPDASSRSYQVILAGNTGAGSFEPASPTLDLLSRQLSAAGSNSAVVFAGDLLPCCGFPDVGEPGRGAAERRLMALVEAVGDFQGRVVVVPGENDWGEDPKTGWRSVPRL